MAESADPDAPATGDNPHELESRPLEAKHAEYKCPECGGAQTLEPGTESLKCDVCGHLVRIAVTEKAIVEYDIAEGIAKAKRAKGSELVEGAREIRCQTCGAETVITEQSGRCPFCDSPVVVALEGAEALIVPESLLPHRVSQGEAKGLYQKWLKSRWFAPSDLKTRAQLKGLDGVYLPYWTYDSETTTGYTGARGVYYYVTEHYTDAQGNRRSRQVRRTRWYPASGTVFVHFDDVLVCASTSLPRPLVEKLEPWDLPNLLPFDGKYLAGFTAERYKVGLEDGFARAEERMEPQIRGAIRSDIGGDEQRIHSMNVRHANVTFKHLLLPLWVSAFRYRERVFRVTVNARSGEVQGERPWSWLKITLFVLMIVALIVAIVVLVQR